MADDVDRMILQMSADLRRMERAFERGQQKANRTAGGIERRFNQMNRSLARSGDQLGRVLGRAFGPLLAAATVAGLARITTGALAAAEAIQDLSSRADVSAEFLQELRYAASQNGAETRDFDDAISRLNRRLGLLLTTGASPAKAAFDELGLTTRIASGELRDAESVFNAAVAAMQGIETQAERSALASQLFGEDSGPRLLQLMSMGTRGIQEQRQAARDLGVVMSNELVEEAGRASDTLERMNMQFSTTVNAAIASQADELVALADALGRVAEWAITAGAAMGDFFSRFAVEGEGLSLPVTEQGLQDRLAQINRLRSELELGGRLDPDDFTSSTVNSPFAAPGQVGLARVEEARAREIGQLVGPTRRRELIAAAEESGESLASVFARELEGLASTVEARLATVNSSPGDGAGTPPTSSRSSALDQAAADTAAAEELERMRGREAAESAAWLRRYNERINLQRIEIENELQLARLRGDDEEVRRLEREIQLHERINELMANGVAYRDAQNAAGAQLDAEDVARRQGEFREFFRGAFRDGMLAALDGNAGEALSSWWRQYVTQALSRVLDNLADSIFTLIGNAMQQNGGGVSAAAAAAQTFAGFFAKGGTMKPGQYGYAGEAGMERIQALPGGGVKITPVQSAAAGGGVSQIIQQLHFHAEGAVVTEDLLAQMQAMAVSARQGAVADVSGAARRTAIRGQYRLSR